VVYEIDRGKKHRSIDHVSRNHVLVRKGAVVSGDGEKVAPLEPREPEPEIAETEQDNIEALYHDRGYEEGQGNVPGNRP